MGEYFDLIADQFGLPQAAAHFARPGRGAYIARHVIVHAGIPAADEYPYKARVARKSPLSHRGDVLRERSKYSENGKIRSSGDIRVTQYNHAWNPYSLLPICPIERAPWRLRTN